MIGHLFKLIWNRRRTNGLILVELFCCFLVLCTVLTIACNYLISTSQPLGYDYGQVWHLGLETPSFRSMDDGQKAEAWATSRQLELILDGMEEIEAWSPVDWNIPFGRSMSGYGNNINGAEEFIYQNEVLPAMKDVLSLKLLAGRWVDPGDEALNWDPVVITRNYARALFGDEDPLGREVRSYDAEGKLKDDEEDESRVRRVVGVISDMRMKGELEPYSFCQFTHRSLPTEKYAQPAQSYLMRLQSGTTAAFEEKLMDGIRRLAPGWRFNVRTLSSMREVRLRDSLLQLALGAVIAVFLIIMVGLGLVGVLWQSVTRRTREWGLRRAVGAPGGEVRLQVLGELLALTTVAGTAGALVFVQLPFFEAFPAVPWTTYLLGLVVSTLGMYLFVIICGLYPSWLATRVQPAEALQYE
jgi:putative ABC transport system permease protein